MPEFSLCADALCPSRQKCLRFISTPSERGQQWMPNIREKGWDRCELFKPAGRQAPKEMEGVN